METVLHRLRCIDTCSLSDALDTCGIAGVIDGLTRRCGTTSLAGRAVTAKESLHSYSTELFSGFAVGKLIDALSNDSVLVVEMGGACVSSFGGLAGAAAARRGASGVILDGGCRDIRDLEQTGLWVASRHATPRSGKGRAVVDAVNVPVRIADVTVLPGDYIVGDSTGIVVIPADRVDDVLPIAERLARRDAEFAVALHNESFAAASKRLSHI